MKNKRVLRLEPWVIADVGVEVVEKTPFIAVVIYPLDSFEIDAIVHYQRKKKHKSEVEQKSCFYFGRQHRKC